MKTYDVKYEIGQEVYFILDKGIKKAKVEKIKVMEFRPYDLMNCTEIQKQIAKRGYSIQYLVEINNTESYVNLDWIHQEEINDSKEALISLF